MNAKYVRLLPVGLVLSVIGLIVGLVLRGKNAAQVHECTTRLGEAKILLSSHFRSVCATAKTMTTTGTALAVVCGIAAAIIVVVGIVHLVNANQEHAAK